MGFISEFSKALPSRPLRHPLLNREEGRNHWRQVFQNKEDTKPQQPTGGSFGRSLSGNDLATKRLLQAMRAMAPGGWSDDRYEQSRHFVGITYVAVHRQNELLTQAEFQVFIKDPSHPDGKREVTPEDPPQGDRLVRPYDLVKLLEHPNAEDNFGDLASNWNLQQELTGMALTWMVPNELGVPFELYSIPTALAVPQPTINPEFPDGYYRIQPVYPYGPFSSHPTPNSAVGAAISKRWMMRFKYPHPLLRYEGYSPLSAMRKHVDQHESMDTSRTTMMRKSFRPSVVLNMENAEGMQGLPGEEIERIKAEVENNFFGPENAGNLLVAYPGSKFEEFGKSPTEMDYTQSWEQVASFILGGGFGVTKQAAGMIEDSAYATLFATLKQLYWLTLNPKANRYGQKLTRFLAPFYGDNLIIEVRCKRIDDHEISFRKADSGIAGKCISKNEHRELLELPPTQEAWGNDIAGDPSPNELAQQQQADAMMGDPMMGGDPMMDAGAIEQDIPAIEVEDFDYSMDHGPDPGMLGDESLGPRFKDLVLSSLGDEVHPEYLINTKSLYYKVKEVISNGSH